MTLVGAMLSESVYTIMALTTASLVATWTGDERREFYAFYGVMLLLLYALGAAQRGVIGLFAFAATNVLTADVLAAVDASLLGRAPLVQVALLGVLLAAAPNAVLLGPSFVRALVFAVGVSWSLLVVGVVQAGDPSAVWLAGAACAVWLALPRRAEMAPSLTVLVALADRIAMLVIGRLVAAPVLQHGPSIDVVGILAWSAAAVCVLSAPLPVRAQATVDSVVTTTAIFVARGLLRPLAPIAEVAGPAALVWVVGAWLRERVPSAGRRLLSVAVAAAAFVTVQSTVAQVAGAGDRSAILRAYALLVLYVAAFGLE